MSMEDTASRQPVALSVDLGASEDLPARRAYEVECLNNAAISFHRYGDTSRATQLYNDAIHKIFHHDASAGPSSPSSPLRQPEISILQVLTEGLPQESQSIGDLALTFDAPHELELEDGAADLSHRAFDIPSILSGAASNQELAPLILHNLGLVFYQLKQTENSMNMFNLALKSLPPSGADTMLARSTHHHMGQLLMFQGETEQAIHHFVQESNVLQNLLKQAASSHTNSGSNGDDDKIGLLHTRLQMSFGNLSRAYFDSSLLQESMLCCEQILRLQLALYPQHDLRVLATTYNIGRIHHKEERFDEALQACNAFLQHAAVQLGEKHPHIMTAMHHVGMIQNDAGLLTTAVTTFTKCLVLRREAHGEVHTSVAETMIELGAVNMEVGNYTRALMAYQRALVIMQSAPCNDPECILMILSYMGQAHYSLGVDLDKALMCYRQVLLMLSNMPEVRNYDLEARVLTTIGEIYLDQGEVRDAMDHFVAAERILPSGDGGTQIGIDVLPSIQDFNPSAAAA